MRAVVVAVLLAPFWGGLAFGAGPKAEKEVTARKGSIQLTLRLYKTKLKKEYFSNLWYQLELKNVGKKAIFIADKLFEDPKYMWDASRARYGVYIEVTEPDWKLMDAHMGELHGHLVYKPFSPEDKKKVKVAVAKWKSEGLSPQQIDLELLGFETSDDKQKRLHPKPQGAMLEPGETLATPPWLSPDSREVGKSPVESFTELDAYLFYRPGKFKIRAVYVKGLRQRAVKKVNKSLDDYVISVATPRIEVEILP